MSSSSAPYLIEPLRQAEQTGHPHTSLVHKATYSCACSEHALLLLHRTPTHPSTPTRTSSRPLPLPLLHPINTTPRGRLFQTANHFGTPLKVYGRDNNRHREGRRNFVEHVDHEDPIDKSKRTRVRFNVEGPHGHGMAYAEVRGCGSDAKWGGVGRWVGGRQIPRSLAAWVWAVTCRS